MPRFMDLTESELDWIDTKIPECPTVFISIYSRRVRFWETHAMNRETYLKIVSIKEWVYLKRPSAVCYKVFIAKDSK